MTFENIIHILFIMAAGQGFLLSLVYSRKSISDERSFKYLALVLAIFSLILLYWLGYWRKMYVGSLLGLGIALDPLDLLLGPAIYFFIRSKLDDRYRVAGLELLHLLPFLILGLNSVNNAFLVTKGYGLYHLVDSTEEAISLGRVYTILKQTQFLAYAIWIWWLTPFAKNDWLKYVAWIYALYVLGRIVYLILYFTQTLTLDIDYIISLVIVMGIYSISYYGSLKPDFFKKQKPYEHSSLSEEHESIICDEVFQHMTDKESFLDSNYSLSQLSKEISIPRHHISQAINHHLNKTFSSLLNEMRVNEAIRFLKDPHRKDDKILKIALDAGFNNKVSFHRYFKEKTGVSPTEFRTSKQRQTVN